MGYRLSKRRRCYVREYVNFTSLFFRAFGAELA